MLHLKIHYCTVYIWQVVSDTMRYRIENKLRRSDFLQLLLDAQQQEATNNNKTPDASPSKKVSEQGKHAVMINS